MLERMIPGEIYSSVIQLMYCYDISNIIVSQPMSWFAGCAIYTNLSMCLIKYDLYVTKMKELILK